MKKNTIIGAALMVAGIFGPFHIGYEVLPDGWMGDAQPGFWWTIPTAFSLLFGGLLSFIFGLFKVLE